MKQNVQFTRTQGGSLPEGYLKPLFHLSDQAVERYPEEGFTSLKVLYLRAGDRLHLVYAHDDPARVGGVTFAPLLPQPSARRAKVSIDLLPGETIELPITADGIYEVGVKDHGGISPGAVIGRLVCPTLERILSSNHARKKSKIKYQVENGLLRTWRHEEWDFNEPDVSYLGVTYGGPTQPVFSTATMHWDERHAPDKSAWGTDVHTLRYRYYVLLHRGDILKLTTRWRLERFDQTYNEGPNARARTAGEVRLYEPSGNAVVHLSADSSWLSDTGICQYEGIYCLELMLMGPLSWKKEPSRAFVYMDLEAIHLRDKEGPRSVLRFAKGDESDGGVWVPVPKQTADALGIDTIDQPPVAPMDAAPLAHQEATTHAEKPNGLNRWAVFLVGAVVGGALWCFVWSAMPSSGR